VVATILTGCALTPTDNGFKKANHAGDLQIVACLDQAPGNLTVTSEGRIIASLHQHFSPELRVVEIVGDGELKLFPNPAWSALDADSR
jgi:hypothetical protein